MNKKIFASMCAVGLCLGMNGNAAEAVFEGLDPLLWQQEPQAMLSHTVEMSVRAPNGAGAVEYMFDCIEGDAPDSPWQNAAKYRITNLNPETTYTFVARVRSRPGGKAVAADARTVKVVTPKADKFDAVISEGIEIIPIIENGDKDNRINILIMNRWTPGQKGAYNSPALRQEFIDDVNKTCRAFILGDALTEKPFANYNEFFNIYAVWWPEVPAYKEGWSQRDYQELRNRLFLPWSTEGRGWVSMMAMLNSDSGGGGAGRDLTLRTGDAMITGNAIGKFLHEFSHTAMGLGDKYIGWGTWGGKSAVDESFVASHWYLRDRLPWKAWVAEDTPIPTPYCTENVNKLGVYEGGVHRLGHIFRSSPYCTMGVSQFMEHQCETCIQRGTQRVYKWVDIFDATYPIRDELTLKEPGVVKFSIDRVKGTPDCQAIEWRLNGKVIARDVDVVEVELGAIARYELVCSMVDHTDLVRHDPPYASHPEAEFQWTITNPKPLSKKAPLNIALSSVAPDCWGQNNGQLQVAISGGCPPYSFEWNNGSVAEQLSGLDGGEYIVDVVDSEFRHATATYALKRPVLLETDVFSIFSEKGWTVVLSVSGTKKGDVACEWSNGTSGLELNGVSDGSYSYQLTHKNGGTKEGKLSLTKPSRPLALDIRGVLPATGENNGEIQLRLEGGVPPYKVEWSDGEGADLLTRTLLPPGDYGVRVRDANQTVVAKKVAVKNVETFVFERPKFDRSATGVVRILNPKKGFRYLWYDGDHPVHVNRAPRGLYEGVFVADDGTEVEATGLVMASSNGKWISLPKGREDNPKFINDFSSWIRLDAYFDGINAQPKTVKVDTDHSGKPGESLELACSTMEEAWKLGKYETTIKADWKGYCREGRLYLKGEGPEGGSFDLRYTGRHENPAKRLHVGAEFRPTKPGNYYIMAQNTRTGAVSFNRIGVAITQTSPKIAKKPLRPDQVKSANMLLWLDPSDMNADGKVDDEFWTWERGIVHEWHDKASDNIFGRIHYAPNAQNGLAIADFQYLWAQSLQEEVKGFQTVIMVYREHDISPVGSSMWRNTGLCFWDLSDKPDLLARVPASYKEATAWLNGKQVETYATSAPLDGYVIATFELPKNNGSIKQVHYHWEGSTGDMLIFDSKLSETDRKGVEEYLRQKWISTTSLK